MKVFIPVKSRVKWDTGDLVTTARPAKLLYTKEELLKIVEHLKQERNTIKEMIEEGFRIGQYSFCKKYLKELQNVNTQLNRLPFNLIQ